MHIMKDQQKSIEIVFDHLHRVVADAAEAVHTPAEGADGTASLFIPDIHRLPAGYERAFPLVMVNASEHRLRDTAGLLQLKTLHNSKSVCIFKIWLHII